MKQKTRKLKGLSPSNVLPNPRGPSNAFSYSDDIVKFAEVTYFIYFYFFFSLTSFLIDKYIYIYIYIYIYMGTIGCFDTCIHCGTIKSE
jgi:hypothetical protein